MLECLDQDHDRQNWVKLFAKVINRRQRLPLTSTELTLLLLMEYLILMDIIKLTFGWSIIHNDLFDLILYVPSTIFQLYRDGSSWVEPVLS